MSHIHFYQTKKLNAYISLQGPPHILARFWRLAISKPVVIHGHQITYGMVKQKNMDNHASKQGDIQRLKICYNQ